MTDNVNHPAYYTINGLEVIDVIESRDLGFHEGNAIKYVLRARYKGNELEDLEKAVWYLQRKIGLLKQRKEEEVCESLPSGSSAQLKC